ncbi:MAG: FKBP-type peptidyl-prolyl cis-trans isomerase [Bacteroidota bacterium]|nr:FKBP-type peptidyl-prolyl cis-trans isomerase [Bacteroidota bacterium]
MKVNTIVAFLITALLSSCWNNSPYKGYTRSDSGLYYKLQTIGDGKNKPAPGDFLQLKITYKTIKDSVFFDSYYCNETGMVILPFNRSSFKGSFEEGLTSMNAGDSNSFIVSADSLFEKFFNSELPLFLEPGSMVKMDVKLHSILTREGYLAELEKYKVIVEDRDIEESRKLKIYLDTNQTQFYQINNGMYYLPVKQGVGDYVKYGDMVKIHYIGYFLNGKQFESTYERGQPLEFNFGEDGQVINGFKTAISLMNEGAKTKFIIPSRLAFGETGSSTNIVPAYSTVIYEIELLNLTKHNN